MIDALRPETTVDEENRAASRYVRSYLYQRVFVGALAVALPVVLVLGDRWLGGDPFPRGSLSAYFYSGMREVFVGALCAIAVFLITYKVAERTLDNTLSWLAGIAILAVALFPTTTSRHVDLTPLQERWGKDVVGTIHYVSAAVFIVCLAVISFYFGVREGARPARPGNRSPAFWRDYHWACAGAIVLAIAWILVTELVGWPPKSLLIGEAAAVWAFGASWLMKGLELDILHGAQPAPEARVPASNSPAS